MDFVDDDPNNVFDKLSKENKSVFLLGDFSVYLLKYDYHTSS